MGGREGGRERVSMLLYVHRDLRDGGAQDGHLDLHTAPEPSRLDT